MLIVVAGPDGCGKDTQAKLLRDELKRRGEAVWLTQEPWTSPYGQKIRQYLRDGVSGDPVEMALLFALDRNAHLAAIRDMGSAVTVTTRFTESSIVYQGAMLEASGVPDGTRWVAGLNGLFPPADLVVVLDVPVDTSLRQLMARSPSPDAYERDKELQAEVARRYSILEQLMPSARIARVQGTGTESEVFDRVISAVDRALFGGGAGPVHAGNGGTG